MTTKTDAICLPSPFIAMIVITMRKRKGYQVILIRLKNK
ncbi:UNVERIFIED_ORG: hypothetical protein QQG_6010 [Clostridioides difficile Y384]